MKYARALPSALRDQVLTPAALRTFDIPHDRLTRKDIHPVSRGVHLQLGAEPPSDLTRAAAMSCALDQTCVSDVTAARMLGLDLPAGLADDKRIHLSQPSTARCVSLREGFTFHQRTLSSQDLVTVNGALVTSPARTWVDLSRVASLEELVQLGDHLVRKPYPRYEDRSHPWAHSKQLHAALNRAGRIRGVRTARKALALIRIGADSFPETSLRLAIIRAGLPEPQLQVPLDPQNTRAPRADAGYRQWRIALQYDGESHFTLEQQRRDQQRNNQFTSAGWTLLCFNARDLRDGFSRAVAQIHLAIATQQMSPYPSFRSPVSSR